MRSSFQRQYEEAFNRYVGTVDARAFALGRQGLVVLLKALKVNKGDKIGVCGFTCFSVVEAVKVCGAVPVYLDVDEYFCIDPQEILRHENGTLKAVILQHTLGYPGHLEELLSACENISAVVIEDCAHSLGCYWKGKALGSFGVGAIYSSEWGKPYSTGQGGMLTVNSQELLEQVDRQIEELAVPASLISGALLDIEKMVNPVLGVSRLSGYLRNFCNRFHNKGPVDLDRGFNLYRGYVRSVGKNVAKAGLKQMEDWPQLMQLRRDNTRMIEKRLNESGLALWPKLPEADVTMLKYPVYTEHRPAILNQSRKQRLPMTGYYGSPVNPLFGDDLAKVDYKTGSCQKSEAMIKQYVYLPTGYYLNEQNLEAMLKIICDNN